MDVSLSKSTVERLHSFCRRGEKFNNLVNRMLDSYEGEKNKVKFSDETVERLMGTTGCKDVDEALNVIMDKYRSMQR